MITPFKNRGTETGRNGFEYHVLYAIRYKDHASIEKTAGHLEVMLEDDGRTHVDIDCERFIQCMRLLLIVPLVGDSPEITSIDEAVEVYGSLFEGRGYEFSVQDVSIDPETELMHGDNLQDYFSEESLYTMLFKRCLDINDL